MERLSDDILLIDNNIISTEMVRRSVKVTIIKPDWEPMYEDDYDNTFKQHKIDESLISYICDIKEIKDIFDNGISKINSKKSLSYLDMLRYELEKKYRSLVRVLLDGSDITLLKPLEDKVKQYISPIQLSTIKNIVSTFDINDFKYNPFNENIMWLIEVGSKTSMSVEDLYIPLDHCVVIVNSYYIIIPNKIVHLSKFEEPAAVYVHKGINFYFQY